MAFDTAEILAPSFQVSEGKTTATRTIHLKNWSDLDGYINDLVGTTILTPQGYIPISYPVYPGKNWLPLQTIRAEPMNNNVGAADTNGVATCSAGARVTLIYETMSHDSDITGGNNRPDAPDLPDVPLLDYQLRGAQQILSPPIGALQWKTAPPSGKQQLDEDFGIGLPVTLVEHVLTWHQVERPPWKAIRDSIGRLNDGDFLGHRQGQVLFNDFSADREIRFTDGDIQQRRWKLQYTFTGREIAFLDSDTAPDPTNDNYPRVTWNHFFRAETSTWSLVEWVNGTTLIQEVDFDKLFKADETDDDD